MVKRASCPSSVCFLWVVIPVRTELFVVLTQEMELANNSRKLQTSSFFIDVFIMLSENGDVCVVCSLNMELILISLLRI